MFVRPLSSTLSTQNFQWRYRDMSYYPCSRVKDILISTYLLHLSSFFDSKIILMVFMWGIWTYRSRTVILSNIVLERSSYTVVVFSSLGYFDIGQFQPKYMIFALRPWLLLWLLVGISWGYSDLSWSPHFIITWSSTWEIMWQTTVKSRLWPREAT